MYFLVSFFLLDLQNNILLLSLIFQILEYIQNVEFDNENFGAAQAKGNKILVSTNNQNPNDIANMITNGESKIEKLVCVMRNGEVGSPCGACREYLMQLSYENRNMEILTN